MLDGSATAQLGKYELLRKLAIGGMAEVYLARTSGLGGFERLVVVKRILPSLATNRDYVERFLDEARIAATLYHRNIVQVFDVGRAGDDYFLAMEYLEGADLRALADAVEPHVMPLPHALQVVLGICDGLHYAHERTSSDGRALGIVHRDLTPHNVFVTFDGEVKIIDFGIVKATDRLGATRHSTMKGKLRYMSPEQIRTQPLDRRSDLFALGILLWELTTGRRLYTAESDFDLMKQIIETEAPLPSTVCAGYPGELESIVMRALARDVNARFATALELHDALESFVACAGLTMTPAVLGRFMRDRIRVSPVGDLVVAAPAVSNVGDVTGVAGIAVVEHHAMPTRHTHSTLSLSSPQPLPVAAHSRRVTPRRTAMLALAVCAAALGLWQVRSSGESSSSSSLPSAIPAALPTETPTTETPTTETPAPATPVAAAPTNEPAAPTIEAKTRSRTPGHRTSKPLRSATKRRVPSRRGPTGPGDSAKKPTMPADGYLDAPLPPP